MAIFGPKPCEKKNPLEKCQFLDFLNCLFLQPRKAFFFVLEYQKRHFPKLNCLKKNVGKMSILGAKAWVNPFGKMSIFPLFKLLLFIAQEGIFSFQNIIREKFPGLYCLKKNSWKNGHFSSKTMGLPLWKNLKFFTFQTSCFHSLERRFSVPEYHKKNFPGLYCLNKKSWKNGHFWTKTLGYPLWKNVIFRLFELLVFIAQNDVFSFQNIIKEIFLAYIA